MPAQVEARERLGGVADLALAGEEHEDVARARSRMSSCTASQIACVWSRSSPSSSPIGPVAHLHGVRPPGHLDHRRAVEVGREARRVDRGRGDDDLEVGPLRQQLAEVAEQEVDVEAALVGLVDDQHLVGPQEAVALDLGQQDAVGHHLDVGVRADPVVEADGVADRLPDLGAELLGDPLGDRPGGQPARLGVADEARARPGPSSRHSFGSCVLLPEPVSPATTTTWWSRIASRMRLAVGDDREVGVAWARAAAARRRSRRSRSVTAGCSACSSRGP